LLSVGFWWLHAGRRSHDQQILPKETYPLQELQEEILHSLAAPEQQRLLLLPSEGHCALWWLGQLPLRQKHAVRAPCVSSLFSMLLFDTVLKYLMWIF